MHARLICFSENAYTFKTRLEYSLDTTTILGAFALDTMPANNLPLMESLPWNGQNSSSQAFRGEATETPMFLTIIYHITHCLTVKYDPQVFLSMRNHL